VIKLIIFDMDGVLVDARDMHYQALNRALDTIDSKYVIGREEHLSTYDGLPTSKKLKMLTDTKGLPLDKHNEVWKLKQKITEDIVSSEMTYDERIRGILRRLRNDGYVLCVASNSIRNSVKMILLRKGLLEFFDFYISNQDVSKPKPSVEMYLRCMIKAGCSPKETLIIEDSHLGRKSAVESGASLCAVRNSDDVTYEKIQSSVASVPTDKTVPKWQGGKMNVLIPMAGAGSRFQIAGYTFPKPLIEVEGKSMIQLVVENLNIDATYTYIVQKSHHDKYHLKTLLNLITPNCNIVQVDGITEGAACTTLLASEFIDNNEPLVIANSDQFIEWESNEFMYSMIGDDIDGGILTFEATHPKWSYAKLDSDGFVCEVAEKNPISNIATVGVYYWKHGRDYVRYAEQMIKKGVRFNKEFYVCPVYNEAIQDGKSIKVFGVDRMWGLGTPEDLEIYLKRRGV
jgi:HAD superfamily hydrolase (TIGR01509 family)